MSDQKEINYLDLPDDQLHSVPRPVDAEPAALNPEPAGGEGEGDGVVDTSTTTTTATASGEGTDGAAQAAAVDAGQQGGGEAADAGGEGGEAAAGAETGGDPSKEAGAVTDPATVVADPAKAAKTEGTTEKPAQVQQPIRELSSYSAEEKASFFDKVMAPFKANGREIQLRSPEEAVQLMQQGANFTKKMQAWQPRMRLVTMLENNGLLDENKLNHLIDVSKGDPLAIQKLLADSQFDPLTVDKDKAADYVPGNHQVSELQVKFDQALDDVLETATGPELIKEIHGQWDQASKEALFQDASLVGTLNQQKELGLYSVITSEIDRLKVLGQIPAGTPFLQAYKAVGDMLNEQGRFKEFEKPAAISQTETAQPTEVRVATPAAQVSNNAAAAAAASQKATAAPAQPAEVNYLNLPDSEFLKQMQGVV